MKKKSLKAPAPLSPDAQKAKDARAAEAFRQAKKPKPQGDRWLLDEIDDKALRQAWIDVSEQKKRQ